MRNSARSPDVARCAWGWLLRLHQTGRRVQSGNISRVVRVLYRSRDPAPAREFHTLIERPLTDRGVTVDVRNDAADTVYRARTRRAAGEQFTRGSTITLLSARLLFLVTVRVLEWLTAHSKRRRQDGGVTGAPPRRRRPSRRYRTRL